MGLFTRPDRLALAVLLAAPLALPASAQERGPNDGPIVDTVIVQVENVFTEDVAQSSFLYRAMNAIHIRTRPWVIRREVLVQPGEPYDSALIAESERNLRLRKIFNEITIDTVRTDDGRLGLLADAQDGWSLKPKFSFAVASDGTLTYTVGLNDINLFGTGNQFYAAYDKQVDRDGLNLSANFVRIFNAVDARANYAGLSDGKDANWFVGEPFRSMDDRLLATYDGVAADQRILQYRVEGAGEPDTTVYRRTAFANNLNVGLGIGGTPDGYTRVGIFAQVRTEEFVLASDTSMVPDTMSATLGAWVEFRGVEFLTMSRFNGFGTEDVDLSKLFRLSVNVTPKAFGWLEDGIAPGVQATYGFGLRNGFVWGSLDANARLTADGVDSSRVVVNVAAGLKEAPRHATVIQIQAGALDNTAPGSEFDLGFSTAPRSWQPHAFVGDREFWISAEHRWFLWDSVLNLFGIGVAGFVDYGGAWYTDQDYRAGGNVGIGLRQGSALATTATMGRIDLGYKIGQDVTGSRWVFAAGAGFIFPRREPPTINYAARPPP
jgi:hypothetical protein